VSLTIIADSESFFRIQDHQIFVGDRFLKSKGQLEKIILKIWLSERANSSLLAQPVVLESLTDLLYFSLNGELDIQDVSSKIVLGDDFQSRWPRVLNNFAGYCRSPWRLNEDISRCQNEAEVLKWPTDQVENLSLRPLVSQSLIAAYQSLKPSERLFWLSNFSQNLNMMAFADVNSLLDSTQLLKETIRFIDFLDRPNSSKKFSLLFESELKDRGFSDFHEISKSYDYLVFTEDISSPWLKQLNKANQRHRIAIEYQGRQISNDNSQIPLQSINHISAKDGIVVRCGEINFDMIKLFSQRVEKLLYIKACGDQIVDLESYFEKGISGLAAGNKNIQFIEFHSSSLKLALKRNPSLERLKTLESESIQANFFNQLGWQKPDFDVLLKAYRAKSVIEAVDWYRL
jgi:hypothetical protein